MSDLTKLYNPANAAALTPEQIEGLQKLTSAEIKELATAYPNTSVPSAYLLIIDGSKPVDKQLPSLSSFENLYNLRERNGMKNYVAFNFKGGYRARTVSTIKPRKTEVVDLSDTELMSLPGFKTANTITPPSEVTVTKVKKATAKKTKNQ